MSKNDIRIVDAGGHNVVPTWKFQVQAGAAASIKAGEPVKSAGAGSPYVILLVNGDHTINTDQPMAGIAAKNSTDTAAADGEVEVYMPLPGIVYEMKATTSSNVDTVAKINLLRGDRVTMDLTGSVFTLDENDGDTVTSAFEIVGGDPTTGTLRFIIRSGATKLGDQKVA